jgi:rubrerythrin
MGQPPGSEAGDRILLQNAAALERAAVAFYEEAGALAPTAHGRRLLRDLAREADLHQGIVQTEGQALEHTGHWLSLEEAASAAPDDGAPPVPSPLPADAGEAEILAQALMLEAQHYQLYQQLLVLAGSEAADVLEFLLRQEAGHCAALQERLAGLAGTDPVEQEEEEPGTGIDEERGPRRARTVGRHTPNPRRASQTWDAHRPRGRY